MELILVRHGETLENKSGICQGQTHGTLTSLGLLQARAISEALAKTSIDACYTSDLRRAADTCEIIATRHPNLQVVKDIRLRERFFGPYQGQTMPQGWDGLTHFEGAEPLEDLHERILSFRTTVLSHSPDSMVLIVSHGVTLRLLAAACLGLDLQEASSYELPANCSFSRLIMHETPPFTVTEYNVVSHLPACGAIG